MKATLAGGPHNQLDYGYPLILWFVDLSTHHMRMDLARAWYGGYRTAGSEVDSQSRI